VRARLVSVFISMGGSESQPATVSEEKDTACDEGNAKEATSNSCKGIQNFTALENGM